MNVPPVGTPIVCDMTDAPDTSEERLAEYRRLFGTVLTGKERTAAGVRFRLRAEEGVEAWVRDLAAREKACCAFFEFDVTADGEEVRWDVAVPDNELAHGILDELYAMPDTLVESVDVLRDRLAGQGLTVTSDPTGTIHHAAARVPPG